MKKEIKEIKKKDNIILIILSNDIITYKGKYIFLKLNNEYS